MSFRSTHTLPFTLSRDEKCLAFSWVFILYLGFLPLCMFQSPLTLDDFGAVSKNDVTHFLPSDADLIKDSVPDSLRCLPLSLSLFE